MTDRTDRGVPQRRAGGRFRVQRFWVIIAAVLVGAVGMVLLSSLMAPERQEDIWVELAKSSAQIVVLVLATGVVGAMLRDRDAIREAQRRHEASLLAFLEQIETTYGQVKTARRMLRTLGFDSSSAMILTADQASGLRVQMALLNDAELSFETYARKVAAMPGLWAAESTAMTTELTKAYQYLHSVLMEWQTNPTVFGAGADTSAMQAWLQFRHFLGYDEASVAAFDDGVAQRMLAIEMLIRAASQPAPEPLLHRHHDGASASPD
jgi:hypothetical protein